MKQIFALLALICTLGTACNSTKDQKPEKDTNTPPAYQIPNTKQMGLLGNVKQMSVIAFFYKTANNELVINNFKDSIHYNLIKTAFC